MNDAPVPSNASNVDHPTQPPPPLDATVEMERPKDLPSPVLTDPISLNRSSSRRFEADAFSRAPQSAPEFDATIEMERPGEANQPSAPVAQMDAAIERFRAPAPEKSTLPHANMCATEAIHRPQTPPTRSEPRRESGRQNAVPTFAKKLGEVLVQMGKLSPEQVQEAVEMSSAAGERVGRWLIRWELVTPDTLCRALCTQTGLPMTMLDSDSMPDALSKRFPLPLMMHHHFVPFEDSGAILCLAASNPLDPTLIREQERIHNRVIEVFLAREDQIARQLDWMRIKLKTRSRHFLRYPLKLAVSYQYCNRLGVRLDNTIHTGSSINVSEGGYLLEGPATCADPSEMLRKGLFANVSIKSMTGEVAALCDIREIRLIEDNLLPRWLLGVEIVEINPDAKSRLKSLCRKTRVMTP